MFNLILSVLAPLSSLVILMLGSGFLGTLLSLRMDYEQVTPALIGLVSSSYYIGMVSGSFRNAAFIMRVGHIRAYSGFASMIAATLLIQGLVFSPWLWCFCRLINGYCVAGLFIVIESWLLNCSSPATRGRFLAIYMIGLYGSQALGQFLLALNDVATVTPFCIISIFASLSIIPLVMTGVSYPHIEEPSALSFMQLFRISPSGILGCMSGGIILAVFYGFVPIFVKGCGYNSQELAMIIAAGIFGGTVLQYPVGKLSDLFHDRRKVLVALFAVLAITSIAILMFYKDLNVLIILMIIFGGVAFTLYPVSTALTCDYLSHKDIIAATQGLVLAYGIGAIVGPMIAPPFRYIWNFQGIFIYFAFFAVLLMLVFLRQLRNREAPTEESSLFVASPNTTPIVAELDPRSVDTRSVDQNAIENLEQQAKIDLRAADIVIKPEEVTIDFIEESREKAQAAEVKIEEASKNLEAEKDKIS